MEVGALYGLADRDEGSVDLADEVRVMLGAFLWPRVGLIVVEVVRWRRDGIVSRVPCDLRSRIAHRWFRNDRDLTRTDEHPMVRFAGEVLDALDRPIVLASGFVQFDSYPFASGE